LITLLKRVIMGPVDRIRSPSWLFMGPREGLRKRRTPAPGSISDDSLLDVSEDELPTDASTPYRVSEDGPILHSILPKMSPKKMETASFGDSGFQDMSLSPEEVSSEVLFARKDTEPSARTGWLPLWVIVAMVAVGAIGFGLMLSTKEDVVVEQLNGKYKSIQFAREKLQSDDNEDVFVVLGDTYLDYFGDEDDGDVNPFSPDYPDDPQFRKINLAKNIQVKEDEHIEEDKVVEYVLKNRRGVSDTQGGYRLPLLILVFPFLILTVKLVRLGSGM